MTNDQTRPSFYQVGMAQLKRAGITQVRKQCYVEKIGKCTLKFKKCYIGLLYGKHWIVTLKADAQNFVCKYEVDGPSIRQIINRPIAAKAVNAGLVWRDKHKATVAYRAEYGTDAIFSEGKKCIRRHKAPKTKYEAQEYYCRQFYGK